MAKVTLVRPPSLFARYAFTLNATPPISLAYVAGSLAKAGHEVAIVDAVGEALEQVYPSHVRSLLVNGLKPEEIVERIDTDTDCIGISSLFTHEWPNIQLLVRTFKEAFPTARIVVGGEHVTAVPEYCLESAPEIDCLVLGEGEESAVELVDSWEQGRGLGGVEGIAFRQDGEVVKTPPRSRIRSVDEIPLPRWDLVDLEPYLSGGWSFGVDLGRTIPMLSTRGCPYQCTFCSSPFMWTTRYFTRDPEQVVEEIEGYIRDYRIQNVDFYDLTAIIKREWIVDFCHLLIERDLGITWQLPSGTRTEAIDGEVAALLYRAGCTNLSYAPESGSERVLKQIKKRVKPERMLQSMREAIDNGLNVKTNMIFGFPDETLGDIWESSKFIARMAWIGVHDVSIWIYSPYPGCELFELLKERGKIREFDEDYFVSLLAYSDFTSEVSYNDALSPRMLKYLRLFGVIAFYAVRYLSSPMRLARTFNHLMTGRYESRMEMSLGTLLRRLRLGVSGG